MLTADGCRQRRLRFWQRLQPRPEGDHVRLADPMHLAYLANFHVDPISLNAGFGAVLIVREDGHARLLHDDRLKGPAASAHVDERVLAPWYDGQTPGKGPRQLALVGAVNPSGAGLRIHDRPGDPEGAAVVTTLASLRRQKDADEIDLLNRTMRAAEAGHAWARDHVEAGQTEIDVYNGVSAACNRAAGQAVIVYGDFAVSPGPERRGGPATARVLKAGDMLILDYSVVLHGYRCDFTNTLVVGRQPSADQRRLFELSYQALEAGEKRLRAGAACQAVYDAVRDAFATAGMAEAFPHHAGHGIGLSHPEAPFFVRHSDEELLENDVVTLEPGLYVAGVGGIRIERNYRVTVGGYELLSRHVISLT